MKKIAVALTIAAAIAAAPAYAGHEKCPSEVARNGGDVASFIAYTLSFYRVLGRSILGDYCRPN